uniref:NADH-ubiquinone oxidoreductase chain 3 n=1 Tax=Metopiellus crypticus TaxID=3140185 RepID=A0AAT9QF17_9COLE|nr:NADH dehydrogenase subunit 3 [Metopiellus sp.]
MYMYMFMIFLISLLCNLFPTLLSMKSLMNREKLTPFECGFDPKNSMRLPFSLQFFFIALIFLIFDIEITMLIPLIYLMKKINLLIYFTMMWIFLLILLMGLYYEWKIGSLNWLF